MFQDQRIGVVIPALNEEAHIRDVLNGLPSWVDVIIVVDDGSRDATRELASDSPRTAKVISHPKSQGVGAAIVSGYRYALACDVGVIAVMAGDHQMRGDELQDVILPVVESRADYSKGNRLRHASARRDMPGVRRWGTRVLGALTTWVSGCQVVDPQCGFTAVSSAMLRRMDLDDLYPRYGFPNDMLAMLGALGARIAEPTVSPVYAGQKSGLSPSRAVFTHSWVLFRAWRRKARRQRVAAGMAQEVRGTQDALLETGRESDDLRRAV